MAVLSETKNIDGMDVTVTQLPSTRGFRLAFRVMKLAAAGFKTVEAADSGAILAGILANAEPEQMAEITNELLSTVRVVHEGRLVELGNPAMIDVVFAGEIWRMLEVIKFSYEVNLKSFFRGKPGEPVTSAKANP